jgi:hypothetical protein
MPRRDLDRLTRRWRQRHEAQRAADPSRPRAEPAREARARRGFPYRSVSPADYVAQHGDAMPGFTYDDESYEDAKLDAWIVELGRLLRARRTDSDDSGPAEPDDRPAGPDDRPAGPDDRTARLDDSGPDDG